MTRVRDSAGFVLTEVLVVMIIGTALLAATLVTFSGFVRNENDNDKRQEQVEKARNSLDIQARQLRNLAKRLDSAVVDTATADDFIFQTSDPARTWVRYCYDEAGGSGAGSVWEQNQALSSTSTGTPVTAQMRQGCPSTSGWSRTGLVSTNVVNRLGDLDRPMFRYQCLDGTSACVGSSATFDRLVGVSATIIIDTTPRTGPGELEVRSAVHLRNQNQAPEAVIAYSLVAGAPRTVILNASRSSDFEGRTLEYYWFTGTMPSTSATPRIACNDPKITIDSAGRQSLWGGTFIGQGVTLTHTWPSTTSLTSPQTVGLVVCDPGDRYGFATRTDVRIG